MTTATPSRNMVRTLTVEEALTEIDALVRRSGMKLDALKSLGERWELGAAERGILSDIKGLEFLIERATR